jgi:hypothetical protein
MKEKTPYRKKNIAVINFHTYDLCRSLFDVSNQNNELIYKQKNLAQKIINSFYSFVFLIPKKVRLYTKPPPKLA